MSIREDSCMHRTLWMDKVSKSHHLSNVRSTKHANAGAGRSDNFASLSTAWSGRQKEPRCITLNRKEVLKFLVTEEVIGLSKDLLRSPQSTKQLGSTDKSVSSHILWAEVSASIKAVLTDNTFRQECSKGPVGRSHCREEAGITGHGLPRTVSWRLVRSQNPRGGKTQLDRTRSSCRLDGLH